MRREALAYLMSNIPNRLKDLTPERGYTLIHFGTRICQSVWTENSLALCQPETGFYKMSIDSLPVLRIGDLKISPPIIQGGMGVRVSRANLASAVGSQGCVGVIASVGLGRFEHLPGSEYVRVNEEALRHEIQKARRQTNGIIGVNVMVALTDYENHVRASVDENVDLIISGAGLPLDLPKLTSGTNIKLLPIVSSARAFNLICKKWKRDFDRLPDAVVVEGSEAGGHLGFKYRTSSITQSLISIKSSPT